MSKIYNFNGHTWDFSSSVLRYDGVPVRSRRTISIMYVNALNHFGYKFNPLDSKHRLPPVMHHPEDISYKLVRDCAEHTLSIISSVTSDLDRQLLCSQSLTTNGYFEDSSGMRYLVCEVYDKYHRQLDIVTSPYVQDFLPHLDRFDGNYLIIR